MMESRLQTDKCCIQPASEIKVTHGLKAQEVRYNELLKDTLRHTKVQKETLSCDKLYYLVWEVAVECDIAEGGTAIVHQDRIKWSENFQD